MAEGELEDKIEGIKDQVKEQEYTAIEQTYLARVNKITESEKGLLTPKQIQNLANIRESFLTEVAQKVGTYANEDEISSILEGNNVDKTIIERWNNDSQYIEGKVGQVRDLKERIRTTEFDKSEAQKVGTQRFKLLEYKNPVCDNYEAWRNQKQLMDIIS
ncbi:hypothetical protein HQ533_05580 [Candidatus Woesearchaeota archaeon]|nr:hypothetical protein [Candidatus Woesearchaeota archaeon]